jgi:predicted kinase
VKPLAELMTLSWAQLVARYPWLRALYDCPQDAVHHAEGDVGIHTRMVTEWLRADARFGELTTDAQETVFAACLLHDVAKPECTRVQDDGRITARGHSNRGTIVARQILWRLGVPFATREAICALVRYHQVPFFLLEKEDPERQARSLTQTARADHLALVAEADARGRVCADAQRLLDNISLFREFCAEKACLDRPADFPSAHARLLYLRGESRDPSYRPHEDFRAEVVVTSGMPGAGKDTWIARALPGWPVVSLDAVRAELDISPQESQGRVIAHARELARAHLRAGQRFVWNATNVSERLRTTVINVFLAYGARVRLVYLEAPEAELFARNRARAAAVPDDVMTRLLDRWEVPAPGEAHEVTYVVR